MPPKITFGKHLVPICALMLGLAVFAGIIEHKYFSSISDRIRLSQQIRTCHLLFYSVTEADTKLTLRFDWGDTRNECAANDWKTAKDKFLSEVNKLAKYPGLGENDRKIVDTIRNSWKGYEMSFNRQILADGTFDSEKVKAERRRIEADLNLLSRMMYASIEEEIIGANRILNIFCIVEGMLGIVSLLIAVGHLVRQGRQISSKSLSEVSELDALKAQAAHLQQSLKNLTALISEFISQKSPAADAAKATETANPAEQHNETQADHPEPKV
jgi:alkylated DNA nucleotide flippase Atl1